MLLTEVNWEDRRVGDIGVLHGSGLLSQLIIEGERLAGEVRPNDFEASHVFIVDTDGIFEAIFPVITTSPRNVYDGKPTRLFRCDPNLVNVAYALYDTEKEWRGKHYDVGGVIGMGLLELERWLGDDTTNRYASSHAAWCSELGTIYLKHLIGDPFPPSTTDPQQLLNYCVDLCGSF